MIIWPNHGPRNQQRPKKPTNMGPISPMECALEITEAAQALPMVIRAAAD